MLAEYLYQLDDVGNRVAVTETIRAPDVVETIDAYVEQNGLLVLEAENGTATAAGSHDWQTQTVQAGYEGTDYRRALPDIGARYEETETASSPQLSWSIYNETGGTYSVWVRGMAPDAGGDSLHLGLDEQAPSSAADLTGFTNEWGWSKATMSGTDASVDLTTTGEHTLEAYMREDGLRVDRVLLVTDTNYIPSGLGPAESPFQTITETVPGGLGTTSIAYSYDALYRLTDATYTGAITATFAYDYDLVGNMTAFTETVDAQTTSVTRSFDAANRLQTSTDAAGTTSYIYDDNGNLTTVYPPGADAGNPAGALRYAYDQRNLMVNHETNTDGSAWVLRAEYVYDGGSDRLQQVDYTGATPITTTYSNDVFGLTQVLVADDGTMQVYNLFGLDLISQDDDSEVRTLLVDGLGSVRVEMVGAVVETATTYSPYGEVLEQTGVSGTVYGFTGEQEDSATGLLYLRARYYNSSLKTFMSRDPWEGSGWRPATLNLYVYAIGNPIKFVDPSGYISCPSPGANCAPATSPPPQPPQPVPPSVTDLLLSRQEYAEFLLEQWLYSPERTKPTVVSIPMVPGASDVSYHFTIMPPNYPSTLQPPPNAGLANALTYLGAYSDLAELCTYFVAQPQFAPVVSALDTGLTGASCTLSGECYIGYPHPDLPTMLVVNQDVLVTTGDFVFPWVGAAVAGLVTKNHIVTGAGFVLTDLITTSTSFFYDVYRANGHIEEYFKSGIASDGFYTMYYPRN